MQKLYLLISLITTMLLFAGCTIEKRVHMPGYHLDWHSGPESTKDNKQKAKKQAVGKETISGKGSHNDSSAVNGDSQPNEVAAVSASANRPEIILPTPGQFTPGRNEFSTDLNSHSHPEKISKKKNGKKGPAKEPGQKDAFLAALLCFFIGMFGIHRFYLGYIGIGIFQLLTLGCCGIWTLIDFIRLMTGSLQPKDGSYKSPLTEKQRVILTILLVISLVLSLISGMIASANQ